MFLPSLALLREGRLPAPLAELEPALAEMNVPAIYLKERSVDPRALVAAALKAAKHRGVDISSGTTVTDLLLSGERVTGISTDKTHYSAPCVVNCAGAWAGSFSTHRFPTRPVKGQMLAVACARHNVVRHVIRAPEVYLVPRSDGRILIGSTLEEAGYDKRTDADTIHRMHQAAIRMAPALAQARILESWAGLRPGTPDDLPILGATGTPGYFVGYGTLSRWHLAHAGYSTCDGASDYGRAERLRYFGVFCRTILSFQNRIVSVMEIYRQLRRAAGAESVERVAIFFREPVCPALRAAVCLESDWSRKHRARSPGWSDRLLPLSSGQP